MIPMKLRANALTNSIICVHSLHTRACAYGSPTHNNGKYKVAFHVYIITEWRISNSYFDKIKKCE